MDHSRARRRVECVEASGLAGPLDGLWGNAIGGNANQIDMAQPWSVTFTIRTSHSLEGTSQIWLVDDDGNNLVVETVAIGQFGLLGLRLTDASGDLIEPVDIHDDAMADLTIVMSGQNGTVALTIGENPPIPGARGHTLGPRGRQLWLSHDTDNDPDTQPMRSLSLVGTGTNNPSVLWL